MITTHEDAILAGEKPGGHDGPDGSETAFETPRYVSEDIDAGRFLTTGIDEQRSQFESIKRSTYPLPIPLLPDNQMIEEPIQRAMRKLLGPPPARNRTLFTKSEYLLSLLESPGRFQETLDKAVKAITPIQDRFEAIAFVGTSGAMLAPTLALHFKKQLLLVRKPNISTHSAYTTEGVCEACDYIFVDDLIASGHTLRMAVETLSHDVPGCNLRAVYTYNNGLLCSNPGEKVADSVCLAS